VHRVHYQPEGWEEKGAGEATRAKKRFPTSDPLRGCWWIEAALSGFKKALLF
jgi:hypothetical protein